MVNNGLPDGVGIDVMLPEYSLTNIPTLNTIMNITKFWAMVTFQHKKTH